MVSCWSDGKVSRKIGKNEQINGKYCTNKNTQDGFPRLGHNFEPVVLERKLTP